jgi:hypothetical protein
LADARRVNAAFEATRSSVNVENGYGARLDELQLERLSMKRKLAGAMTTLLVAGLAAGCGGDDGKGGAGATTGAGTGLTKAQFIERGDAICAAADKRIEAAGAKLRQSSKKDGTLPVTQVVRFLTRTTMPTYDRMLISLRNLAAPKADEQKVDAFVASVAGAIDAVKANPRKYAKRTTADPFDDANERAKAYGFKVCGS